MIDHAANNNHVAIPLGALAAKEARDGSIVLAARRPVELVRERGRGESFESARASIFPDWERIDDMVALTLQFGKVVACEVVDERLTLRTRETIVRVVKEPFKTGQVLAELGSW